MHPFAPFTFTHQEVTADGANMMASTGSVTRALRVDHRINAIRCLPWFLSQQIRRVNMAFPAFVIHLTCVQWSSIVIHQV